MASVVVPLKRKRKFFRAAAGWSAALAERHEKRNSSLLPSRLTDQHFQAAGERHLFRALLPLSGMRASLRRKEENLFFVHPGLSHITALARGDVSRAWATLMPRRWRWIIARSIVSSTINGHVNQMTAGTFSDTCPPCPI
jgi:hypothetical protein